MNSLHNYIKNKKKGLGTNLGIIHVHILTMNSPRGLHLLSQAGNAAVTHDGCIQGIEALPGVRRGVGRLTVEPYRHSKTI